MPVETECKICGESIYLVAVFNGDSVWAQYWTQITHAAVPPDAIAQAFKSAEDQQ